MKYCLSIALFSLVIMAFSPVMAEKGLVIESRTTIDFMGMGGTTSTSTVFLKPGVARTFGSTEPQGMMSYLPEMLSRETNNLINLEKRIGWNLDTLTKTYTEIDLAPPMEPDTAGVDTGLVSFNFPKDTAAGSYVWETTWDSTAARENVNGFSCRKYTIRTVGRSSVEEKDSCLVNSEFWISRNISGRDIYKAYAAFQMDTLYLKGSDVSKEDDGITDVLIHHVLAMERKSLASDGVTMKYRINAKMPLFDLPSEDKRQAILDGIDTLGLPDSTDAGLNDQVKGMLKNLFSGDDDLMDFINMSHEVISIKHRDLDDSLFVIPDGYSLKEETEME
jgi:hypothetical protein